MDSINKSFGARFGTGISCRQGIVQDLNRNAMLGTSHIFAVFLHHYHPVLKQLVLENYIILNGDLYVQQRSPDGGNVGIINHLSIIARVTNNISETGLYDALVDGELIKLENSSISDITKYTNVFLNGKMVGFHKNPSLLQKYMKLLKLNSFINITTSDIMEYQNK